MGDVTAAPERLDPFELAARRFEAGVVHRYADPLELGQALDPPRLHRGKPKGVHRTRALDAVCGELVRLADQDAEGENLQIYVPPQEGKSTTVARWFALWLLVDDPTLNIAIVSYAQSLALRHSRWLRKTIREHPELGVVIPRGSQAAAEWETTAGGGVVAVGMGGGITGRPVDVLIIDDPFSGRAQAESETYRKSAWEWWENNGATRLSSRGRVVLMMTRWHTDDLAGRLAKHEPSDWRVLRIPAIAEEDDPLGREPGEELESVQRRAPGHFAKLQKIRTEYVWLSVYQQRPTSAQGNLFKRDRWRFWELRHHPDQGEAINVGDRLYPLAGCVRFITADLATSTKTSADWTVFSAWAIPHTGDLVLLDRVRVRVAEADHYEQARPLIERWRIPTVYVEASQHSTTIAYEGGRAGIPIAKLEADADKLTRAIPAAERQNRRTIYLPAGAPWLAEWIDEHADFPNVAHDDQVDTSGYAARVHGATWIGVGEPAEIPGAPASGPPELAELQPTGVDFMRSEW